MLSKYTLLCELINGVSKNVDRVDATLSQNINKNDHQCF